MPARDAEPSQGTSPTFSVDTHLFRELGELLVGRDSTALVELIKNAYDADATVLTLTGYNLTQPNEGLIELVDDGNGMRADQFRRGFLRVAARGKSQGDRRTPLYLRRFTGEKGIGRLAAHKLASRLDLTSVAATEAWASASSADQPGEAPRVDPMETGRALEVRLEERSASPKVIVSATLDWDVIEQFETLDEITAGIYTRADTTSSAAPTGTRISLSRIRRPWTTPEIGQLVRQVTGFAPPPDLMGTLPEEVISEPLLFTAMRSRDAKSLDPGFRVDLGGDFDAGEEYWRSVVSSAAWVLEIDAGSKEVKYGVAPSARTRTKFPRANKRVLTGDHPDPIAGPFFKARIILREGNVGKVAQAADWYSMNGGIRAYLEGFRVLPYGEPRDDWLGLDFDYTRRGRTLPMMPAIRDEVSGEVDELDDENLGLTILPNRSYFGVVLLTEEGAPGLRSLVNREGFVPNKSYDNLVSIVRGGIDVLIRVRARATYEERQRRAQQRTSGLGANDQRNGVAAPAPLDLPNEEEHAGENGFGSPSATELVQSLASARSALTAAISDIGDTQTSRELIEISERLTQAEQMLERVQEDNALLRTLASVGTQLASFTHELNGLLETARRAELLLQPTRQRSLANVLAVRESVTELRRALERQAAYLLDVISPDARRRRTRQRLRERFESAWRLVSGAALEREILVSNQIPPEIETAPMFTAELAGVLANILTNAVKAAGFKGQVSATGSLSDDGRYACLRVENTGMAVDLADAERWFAPFESSTTVVDPVLGQGMGLGLPISRLILNEYGGSIRFVDPRRGFATAVELMLPASVKRG